MDPDAVRAMAASMPVIEQAKGIVMGCYGCDAAAAFAVLVRLSASKNLKLRDLAAAVVEAASGQHQPAQGRSAQGPSLQGGSMSPFEQVRRVLTDGHSSGSDGRGYRS